MPDGHHLHWGAESLWQELDALLPGISVEIVARIDSTNSRLLERARLYSGRQDAPITRPGQLTERSPEPRSPYGRRQGDVQPCLLAAEHQTRGRGRLGRGWQAEPGASLTFSLSLPLAPRDWSGLSLAVGVALADALDPPLGAQAPRLLLKWPNDIWLADAPHSGRKLGGILIETVAVGAHRMCVVGVGLNVNPLAEAVPAGTFGTGYGCLRELDPEASAPKALSTVAVPLVRALQRFEAEGFAPFAADFARRDLLCGQAVTTGSADVPEGLAEGVDDRGALLVRAAGRVHTLVSGEVSVRLRTA